MATAEMLDLMTAEEFGKRPDPGYPEELVRGRVVSMPVPDRRHGYVCLRVGRLLSAFVEKHDAGRVMSNDAGIITGRDPDSVRGADIAFYSFKRLPKGPLAPGYGPEVPELVVEVRSQSDRWRDIHEKITEYLSAGVSTVVVLDPGPETAHVFSADDAPKVLTAEDELVLSGILEEFRVRVGEFFK
jgi:Uma2 family endonuclease